MPSAASAGERAGSVIVRRVFVVPAVAALAAPAQAAFAPPIDVPLACTVSETRDDDGVTRTFTSERIIMFRRERGAIVAELRLLPRVVSDAHDARAMVDAGLAALSGSPIRYRLDERGSIVAIDELDAIWARVVAAIREMGRGDPARAATAGALSQAIAALPTPRRHAMLSSMLAPVLGGDDVARVAGEDRAVAIAADRAGGGGTPLTGRETTRALPGDAIEITTHATGIGGTTALPDLATTLLRVREVDRRTGLVRRSREETVIAGGGHRARIVKTTIVALKVS